MAGTYHTVSIYPYPLTNLVVQCGWDAEGYNTETVVDCGDHYEVQDLTDGTYVKISADGYNTLKLITGTYDINIGNWYAWTGYVDSYTEGSTTVTWYTLSATPSVNDSVYITPPYLNSVVTGSTRIYGDIDVYSFYDTPVVSEVTDTTITVGSNLAPTTPVID